MIPGQLSARTFQRHRFSATVSAQDVSAQGRFSARTFHSAQDVSAVGRFSARTFHSSQDVSAVGRFSARTFQQSDVSAQDVLTHGHFSAGRFSGRTFQRSDVSADGRFGTNVPVKRPVLDLIFIHTYNIQW
jgi:hypothetical protein